MIVQKLRLQSGWSQQQLAEMSGLSKRTIQRIENGQTPSVESVKSLAAVFEVDFSTLQGALTMNTETISNEQAQITDLQLSDREKNAYEYVRKLKRFYADLLVFVVVIAFLTAVNGLTSPHYWWVIWVFLGWGLSFAIRAVKLFFPLPLFGVNWEKQQVEKFIDRK